MIVYPNAKVNIGLNIISRRPDGYHDIETLFYPVPGLFDILEIIKVDGENNTLEFSQSGLRIDVLQENNLCVRAYHLLAKRYGLPHVKMHLHKSIPMGAGLGGGSADAAFALKELNSFLVQPVIDQELSSIALELGSDCPFFQINQPAIGRGRGELLEPINISLKGHWIMLVNPGIHVSTATAYAECSPKPWAIPIKELAHKPLEEWKDCLMNDFEPTVFTHHPGIELIKRNLYSIGAKYAAMSGSGSTVYGIFDFKPDIPQSFSRFFTFCGQL